MRFNKIFSLVVTVVFLFSCNDNNDDVVTPTNKFTVGSQDFETPNCYIQLDEPGDNNADFSLFFVNGRMFDNDANVNGSSGDFLYSLNTTHFVFYNIRAEENPSIEIPQYPNIQTGVTYYGGQSDTVIAHGFTVNALNPNFNTNGFDFGSAVDNTGTVHEPNSINTSTIIINAYNFDTNTQVGTIDVDYQFTDTTGTVITGHYDGTLGVIFD